MVPEEYVSHPKGRVIWWTLSAPSLSSKESQEDSLVNLILNFRLRLPTPTPSLLPFNVPISSTSGGEQQ